MNKKIIGLMFVLVLVGFVTADILLSNLDKNVIVDSVEKQTALTNVGIPDYTVNDYTIGTEYEERCLISPSDYNLPCQRFTTSYQVCDNETEAQEGFECSSYTKYYHNATTMLEMMDSWEETTMDKIASAEVDRQSNNETKTLVGTGTTTITDK